MLWDMLKSHIGHQVRIVAYGDTDDPMDICLECEECGEVILGAELYHAPTRGLSKKSLMSCDRQDTRYAAFNERKGRLMWSIGLSS